MSFQLPPNVDKNRIFLIQRSALEERLDCEYYQPSHYHDLQLLKASPYGNDILDHVCFRIVDGPFGSSIKSQDYVESGIPFLRVADVTRGKGSVKTDDLIYITEEAHQKIIRSRVVPNDVVIAKTGATMGAASLVPANIPEANIRGDLAALSLNQNDCLPQYIVIYINTNIGQRLFWRLDSGGTRGRVVIGNLKKYPIVIPPIEIQKKIIARMNAAYDAKKQKEEEAQRLLDSIDDYLLSELGINLPEPEENTIQNRVFYRKLSEVSGGRFDPNNYQNERLEAINSLKNGIFLVKKLCKIVAFRSIKTNEITEETVYIGMENITSNTGEIVTTNEKDSISSASIFMKNDVLFPKLRPYLNKVYCAEEEGICSTEFHVLHSNSECNEFIANLLRSRVVVSQTKCLTSGNTLPRLQLEDINKFLIPIPPLEKQLEIIDRITTIRTQAKQLRQAAAAELEQAKQEVEAMILGERGNKA